MEWWFEKLELESDDSDGEGESVDQEDAEQDVIVDL